MRKSGDLSEVEGRSPAEAPSDGERLADPASRRRFVQLLGAGGAAAGMATLLAACGGEEESPQDTSDAGDAGDPVQPATDLEIANYALFLEYLEEDFYRQITASGQLGSESRALAEQVRQNEAEHVKALDALVRQLAGSPAARPKPRFDGVIAGGEQRILETAATIENLGAAAYLGQASRIENTQILETALAIHTVEARHAAAFNELAGTGYSGGGALSGSIPNGAFGRPLTRDEVLDAAAPYLRG